MAKQPKPTILCLSSDATPRYKRDIVQVLALPEGVEDQFRYAKVIVESDVWAMEASGKLVGCPVVVAFLDRGDPASGVKIVPCRMATISKTETQGSTLTVTLKMGAFVSAKSDFATKNSIALPTYDGNTLKGNYCSVLKKPPVELDSTGVDRWEDTVSNLCSHAAFKDELCFYQIKGIFEAKRHRWASEKQIANVAGTFNLSYGRDYELRLYHFFPVERKDNEPLDETALKKFDRGGAFQLMVAPPLTLTSRATLDVDSPYDIKRVRFRCGAADVDSFGLISIQWKEKSDDEFAVDLDLNTKVGGLTRRTTIVGGLAGLGLSIPPIVDLFRKRVESQSTTDPATKVVHYPAWNQVSLSQLDWAVVGCYAVLYVLVGTFAAFKIRKPL